MNRDEIVRKINEFLVEEFEIEASKIIPEAQLIDDLEIESLDFVDIIVIVEKDFGFKVKREEMTEVRTLNDLYKYIEERA